ncbi:hypothetical protein PI125_g20866 [Phytophthora idaei]|nr:hypothetical protein PI125_g20866 [Phytophthora idaei]
MFFGDSPFVPSWGPDSVLASASRSRASSITRDFSARVQASSTHDLPDNSAARASSPRTSSATRCLILDVLSVRTIVQRSRKNAVCLFLRLSGWA